MALNFRRSFSFLAVISLLVFSIGCSTMSVSVQKGVPKLQKDAKIAYFKSSFFEIDYPIFPLLDVGIYKSKVNGNIAIFKQVDKNFEGQIVTYSSQAIKAKTGNTIVVVDTPFKSDEFNFFDSTNSDTEAKIAAELKKNNAVYAYIPVMRIKVNGVAAFGVNGASYYETKIYVCDKDGKIIGKGYVSTEYDIMYHDDTANYINIIKSAEPLIKQLINQMFQ